MGGKSTIPTPSTKSPEPTTQEKEMNSGATRSIAPLLEAHVQKRTRQLEKAKREWEQTFDAIDQPVLLLDGSYQIQRANLALASAVGKDIRILIGKACHQELFGRDAPCPNCPIGRSKPADSKHPIEIEHKNKRPIYTVRSFPMPGDDERYVHTYHDITEEKEIQKKLIESEKLSHLGMLAGQVAHEINNPLAGILAQAQMLLMDLEGSEDESMRQAVKDIEIASQRCRKIISNLLNFSRRSPVDRKAPGQLNDVIQHTLPLYHMTPPRPGPTLHLDLQLDLPQIQLDPDKMQSVILNLLCNAKAATPQTGDLYVSTKSIDNAIEIEVRDTGEGIPPGVLGDIFKPFYTTKPRGLGTGIGLYIVDEIVRAHDGTIAVESQPGEGTTFSIKLPLP